MASSSSSSQPEDPAARLARAEKSISDHKNGLPEVYDRLNDKVPLDDSSVVQLLETARTIRSPERTREYELFLIRESKKTLTEKREIAKKFNLEDLKKTCIYIEMQQEAGIIKNVN